MAVQSNPKISVVIPTWNRAGILEKCLAALSSQTLEAHQFEVLVVDGSSSDQTRPMVESFAAKGPFQYVAHGLANSQTKRNVGIQRARGEIVLHFSDDMMSPPDLLAEHVEAHRQHPDPHVAVLGHIDWPPSWHPSALDRFVMSREGGYQFAYERIEDPQNVPFGFFYASHVSTKRRWLLEKGLYDPSWDFFYEDTELGFRLAGQGMRMIYQRSLVAYHDHPMTLRQRYEKFVEAGRIRKVIAHKHPQLRQWLEIDRLAAHAEVLPAPAVIDEVIDRVEHEPVGEPVAWMTYDFLFQTAFMRGVSGEGLEAPLPLLEECAPVAVVIPNWNGARFLLPCLTTLLSQRLPPAEIIVVDNGSTDGSQQLVSRLFPAVQLKDLGRNFGFVKPVNEGITLTTSPLVWLMNNDIWMHPDCLWQMAAAAKQRPDVGSFAAKMLFYQDRPTRMLNAVGDGLSTSGRSENIGYRQLDRGQYDTPRDVWGACAGAALYRRSLFDRLGLFDETYFAVYDDVDFACRVQAAGERCLTVPSAVVYHRHFGTLGSGSDQSVYLAMKNDSHVVVRNFPWLTFFKYFPRILLVGVRRAVGFALRRQAGPAFQGEWRALMELPIVLAARRKLSRDRVVSRERFEEGLS